jgi:putative addiction module antidote
VKIPGAVPGGIEVCRDRCSNVRYNESEVAMATKVKITTVGNSAGIVLPRDILARLKVGKGDMVTLSETPFGFYMTAYDENFMRKLEATEKVMRNYRDALKKLAE